MDNVETYMVVMRNVFSSHMRVHKKYDLKGSTVDREVKIYIYSYNFLMLYARIKLQDNLSFPYIYIFAYFYSCELYL